jgi:hypothetical protein
MVGGDAIATSGGDKYAGIGTVAECISAGIDRGAISSTVLSVIRVCGLRART